MAIHRPVREHAIAATFRRGAISHSFPDSRSRRLNPVFSSFRRIVWPEGANATTSSFVGNVREILPVRIFQMLRPDASKASLGETDRCQLLPLSVVIVAT